MAATSSTPLDSADLSWVDGVPYSTRYGDVYYSRHGGLEESRAVFLAGNRLPERWVSRPRFAIGEIGFGTGLNFLATLALWNETASTCFLSYWAIEHAPLHPDDVRRVAARWPDLIPYAEALSAVYPPLRRGWYRRYLCSGRVSLTLVFDDALTGLAELDGRVDAWYLDGFAPARNAEAWSPELCGHLARLSIPGSTFSTYTAAGVVRRALGDVGFDVDRIPGYGGKKERLCGVMKSPPGVVVQAQPWFASEPATVAGNHVAVIGAGVAGVTVACRLSQSGYQVSLIEQQPQLGCGASGNPAAVIAPGTSQERGEYALLVRRAFDFTTAWLDQLRLRITDLPWHPVGVLVANADEQVGWCDEFVENVPESIKETARLSATTAMRWYPRAGWIEPGKFLADLLECHACRFLPATTVTSWCRENDQWLLRDENGMGIVSVDALVVTTGVAESFGIYPPWMKLTPVRGQITTINASDASVPLLRCVLAERRYVIPGPGSSMTVGATFQPNDLDATCRGADDNHNLEIFAALWPNHDIPAARSSRVAWRAASLDYRPYVGAVPRVVDYIQSYSALKQGNPRTPFPLASYEHGVFVMLGFGSRGFTLAPLAAEIVADTLAGLPQPVPRSVLHSLHPARHLIRAMRRGENVQVGLWSKD